MRALFISLIAFLLPLGSIAACAQAVATPVAPAPVVGGPAAKATGPTFPGLTGRVVDQANIIPAEIEAQLTARLEALEAKSSDQLVVATVPSLQGYEIEEYGYRLGRAWQIGQGERLNNGVILLVAPNERKVRIEVGYGLEGVLTDMFTGQVMRNNILPAFKAGDMPAGIVAGVDGIEQLLMADPAELQARAQRGLQEKSGSSDIDGGAIVFLFFFILFWIWIASMSARQTRFRRRGNRGSGWGGAASSIHDWDNGRHDIGAHVAGNVVSGILGALLSGGGGGGGSGGGGGFSGGGGSFGGGGSSGSW